MAARRCTRQQAPIQATANVTVSIRLFARPSAAPLIFNPAPRPRLAVRLRIWKFLPISQGE